MNKLLLYSCTVLSLITLPACLNNKNTKKPSFVLVNVLDKEYYDMCHIKGDINVPFTQVEQYALQHWDKNNTEIVTYCSNYMCTASFHAAKHLQELGYKKVAAYEGGAALAHHDGFAMEGNDCNASWLQDYDSKGVSVALEGVTIIESSELKEKLQKNAAN